MKDKNVQHSDDNNEPSGFTAVGIQNRYGMKLD